MKGVEIRQAVAADKSAVLTIQDNLYNGADYMEALFDSFISCPHTNPYVLVFNNEIVSFVTAFFVDDGNTVISRGGRTKDKWAGLGFYKMLIEHCLETCDAKVLAFTTDNCNKALASSSFQRDYQHILSKLSAWFDLDVQSLSTIPPVSIDRLTKNQLEHYMISQAHKQYLFPNHRLVVNWVPFKLLPSNIPLLWESVLLENETYLILSDVRSDHDVMTGLMSIATTYKGTGGMFVANVDIYGTDRSSLKRHIDAHLDFIRKRTDGSVTVMKLCDQRILSLVNEMFLQYNIAKSNSDEKVEILHLFEKQL